MSHRVIPFILINKGGLSRLEHFDDAGVLTRRLFPKTDFKSWLIIRDEREVVDLSPLDHLSALPIEHHRRLLGILGVGKMSEGDWKELASLPEHDLRYAVLSSGQKRSTTTRKTARDRVFAAFVARTGPKFCLQSNVYDLRLAHGTHFLVP